MHRRVSSAVQDPDNHSISISCKSGDKVRPSLSLVNESVVY